MKTLNKLRKLAKQLASKELKVISIEHGKSHEYADIKETTYTNRNLEPVTLVHADIVLHEPFGQKFLTYYYLVYQDKKADITDIFLPIFNEETDLLKLSREVDFILKSY